MSMWLIATFGSSYVAKAQENFIEPFFIVKLILVIVVLPLLMYTCRQKCIKNGPRVAVQDDLRTEKESATEKTSDTAENKTKKRRRQKKKRSTKNSEEKEQSSGGNKAKKHIDAACTGEEVQNQNADTAIAVKQGKDDNKKNKDVASRPSVSSCTTTVEDIRDVKKRKKVRSTAGCDVGGGTSRLDDKNSENAGASDRVEVKDGKKGHKYATSSYIPNKSKNSDESCTVKEARNVGGGCKKLLENAIFSVLNQKSVCQNETERNEGRLRGVNKLDNIPCEGTEESDSARNVNSRACRDTTPRQKQTSLAHKTNRKPSVNGMEHQETDCQGDGVGRTKNQSQGRFFSDSPEGQRNKANANADHQRWGTVPRRRSCDRNSEKDPKENEFPENHRHSSAVSCTERRSFDHSSEKDPRQSEPLDNDRYPTDNQRGRRSSDRTSESDPRQSELLDNDRYPTDKRARRRSSDRTSESDPIQSELVENERNYPTDKRARRRSSDHTSEKDPRQSELVDNDRYPTDKRARRRSSDRTSESDPRQSELVENERNYPTDKRARRRSSDHTSEKNPRQSELLEIERNYPTDKGTRRRSSDRTSESDPRQSELLENDRNYPTDKRARRRSSDHTSEKDPRESELLENDRNYPTDKGTRRRSSDRSSESDPRQSELMANDRNYPTDKRARRRSFDHTSEKDARQSEFLENGRNYPTDKRARRRSFDRTSENVPRVSELPENRRDCSTNNRRGRRSSDCTSENDPKERNLRESHRYPADNRAKRRSSCHTSENVSRGSELPEKHRQLTELQRRRRSFDRTSESDPRQIEILENHRRPTDNRTRRRSSDGISENVPGRSELPENSRHCPTDNGTSTESEKPDEYEQGKTEHLTEPSPVHTAEADNEIFEATSTADKAGPKPSSHEGMKAVNGQGTLGSEQGPFVIDPEVRERIANPKYPVRVPDKPVLHLSYRDSSYRPDNFKGPNKSLVGGLFGRKWRKEMEKKELKRQAEEDAEEDRRRAEFLDHCDNTCPTFMVWGVCHRGDRCPLQHPSYRYLERPPRKAVSPENTSEEPKRDPNSYAAILEKRNSSEPEEFCNEAVLHNAESTTETNGISYSKALVNAKPDRQTSKVPVTKTSYEESWPSLGSSVQGRDVKAPKQDPVNVSQAWTSQKGSRITLEEKPKTTVDKLHTVSDAIIAQELQADEYAEMNEYDDYSYHPEEEFYEDNIYDQGQEDTNEDDESSFDSHDNVKALELEQLNSNFHSSPVIMEQSTGDTENPAPPRVVSSPCDICMDRPKDATLVCGHRFCYVCALQMRLDERVCAICRRCIVSVIKTYN